MDHRLAKEDQIDWETEPPECYENDHLLYLGIHRDLWCQWPDLDKIHVNFFMTQHALRGLSVDWSKYADPKDTLAYLNPSLNVYGIAEVKVGDLRTCIDQYDLPLSIKHDPVKEPPNRNRAHTLIKGVTKKNKASIKRRLYKLFQWAPDMEPLKD